MLRTLYRPNGYKRRTHLKTLILILTLTPTLILTSTLTLTLILTLTPTLTPIAMALVEEQE